MTSATTTLSILAALGLGLAAPARADTRAGPLRALRAIDDANVARERGDGPAGDDYLPLARSTARVVRPGRPGSDASPLEAATRLRLPHVAPSAGGLTAVFDLDRPIAFRLPDLPPEELRIEVPLLRVATAYVWADLGDDLPRLDAVDGDTYFTPGLEVPLPAPGLRLFVEDFQPASGVVGGAERDAPAPRRSWDGHQVALGARWAVTADVQVEAETIGYVLSATHREPGVGALVSVSIRY
jgi:hypothetical protein